MEMEMEKMISSSNKDGDADDAVLLPGFRFHPTDEELVGFYLRRKVEKKAPSIELIKQIDIYKYDPWDLPKVNTVGDKEWFFFCIRERKYKNSARPNRVTRSGFWKATGIDKPIYSVAAAADHTNDCIGLKKSLVFYRGSAGKGTKTDWMMHEFRLPVIAKTNNNNSSKSISTIPQETEVWTLCRIFKRNASYKKYPTNCRQISLIKQNPTCSSSMSCSLESENKEKYNYFGTSSTAQQNGKRPIVNHHIDEMENHCFSGTLSSITQEPFAVLSPEFPNTTSEIFRDRNWDEFGNIMEFVSDPTVMYGYRCA